MGSKVEMLQPISLHCKYRVCISKKSKSFHRNSLLNCNIYVRAVFKLQIVNIQSTTYYIVMVSNITSPRIPLVHTWVATWSTCPFTPHCASAVWQSHVTCSEFVIRGIPWNHRIFMEFFLNCNENQFFKNIFR